MRTKGQLSGQLFPKGGHSATQTELKVKYTNVRWNITETLKPKTGNKEPHQNHRLGTVSKTLLGGLKLVSSPSISDVGSFKIE